MLLELYFLVLHLNNMVIFSTLMETMIMINGQNLSKLFQIHRKFLNFQLDVSQVMISLKLLRLLSEALFISSRMLAHYKEITM
jgi:hypothetical protein